MIDLKQFALSNGDQIICEVIDWPQDEDDLIVVRKSMKIISIENQAGVRYYTLRPWMLFQDDSSMFQTINPGHIIGEANPKEELIEHYNTSWVAQSEDLDKGDPTSGEDYMEQLREKLKAAFENSMEEAKDNMDFNTVIKFPNKDKLH